MCSNCHLCRGTTKSNKLIVKDGEVLVDIEKTTQVNEKNKMPASSVSPQVLYQINHKLASASVYACVISSLRTRHSPHTADHEFSISTNVALCGLGLVGFHMTFTFLNMVPRFIIAAWENTTSK